ncbi:MAG: HAD family hydrolase [Bacteroidetes bacterium GWA2_30_7]|nr:MAG: HAD family hydrolase [Bacteroidetes bacterium GWA2_30_7]
MQKIKVIGFDADDTLWVNEPYFQDVEKSFCELMEDFLSSREVSKELFKTEIQNIEKYGYGIKGFTLSMIETALRISNNNVSANIIEKIINLGKSLFDKPIELLDNIEFILQKLKDKYKIIVATKGDLLDQQRKLKQSGLLHYFHHIEIMTGKEEKDYLELIKRLKIKPEEFLMIGNSIMSDILPVISIGGQAIHVPYHITWQHEISDSSSHPNEFKTLSKLSEILNILPLLNA